MTHQQRYKAYYAERDVLRYQEDKRAGRCVSCHWRKATKTLRCARCARLTRGRYVRKGYHKPTAWTPTRRLLHEMKYGRIRTLTIGDGGQWNQAPSEGWE